jgi:hypothetical protein
MSTRSDSIDAQLVVLHKKIVEYAAVRKYDEIDGIRAEIRALEEQRLTINKMNELKILMSIMTGATPPTLEIDKLCFSNSPWNPHANTGWEQRANKRILLAIYEAVVELDRKVNSI